MSNNNQLLKKEVKNNILDSLDDKDKRITACRNNILLFSLYYFSRYHHFIMPLFHKSMYRDVAYQTHKGVLWEMYRESAKTSVAKIKFIHNIVYKTRRFNIWASYDQKKAEANLFDIALELQTNEKLIADFGQMFYSDNSNRQKQSKKQSIKEFITTNEVKVKAYSTGQSIRGEVYREFRPDFIALDDIETSKTMVSVPRTEEVIEFLNEMISGLAGDAQVLVLANRITDTGSIAYLKDKIKGDKHWIYRAVAVKEDNKIMWPQKYVNTDSEAEKINLNIKDSKKRKISLETKKRELGDTVYSREMMNKPLSDEEREFPWKWMQESYDPREVEALECNRYICIDVADSKQRSDRKSRGVPDYTGTVVVDVDSKNNWYVRMANRKRMNSAEVIDWIFYLWQTYKPLKIGVEKKAFEDQIVPYIRAKSEKEGIFPVVEELMHKGKRKEDRIRGALQGRFQARKIKFLYKSNDNTDDLKLELHDFPKGKFDDLADALAYVTQLAFRPLAGPNQNLVLTEYEEFMAARNGAKVNTADKIRNL